MARPVWSGSIDFGLVNVAVRAFTAVRDHDVHFHQIDELSLSRTRSVEVSEFVDLDAIDPIYYERTYWLAPANESSDRAYHLLLAAMAERKRVGIGSIVMRNKQYLAAIRPLDGVLAMSMMHFADEIVPHQDLDELPSKRVKPAAKELKLATQIIDSLAADWKPDRYHDTYTEELRDLIERKGSGEEITPEESTEHGDSNVLDLMAALEASIGSATKKAPAAKKKKPATSKSA